MVSERRGAKIVGIQGTYFGKKNSSECTQAMGLFIRLCGGFKFSSKYVLGLRRVLSSQTEETSEKKGGAPLPS